MKRLLLSLSLAALVLPLSPLCLSAQNMAAPKAKRPPLSPPEVATATIGNDAITILYSSPRVRGREGHIFGPGGLIQKTHKEYPIWRAGANAATSLKTSTDMKIGQLLIPKGSYTLFVDISNPDQWTLVVSKDTGEWGLSYNAADDLGRVKMHMSKPPQSIEDLMWSITPEGHNKGKLTLGWEDHVASVRCSAK